MNLILFEFTYFRKVPNFRIVKDKFGKEHAEYLVVVSLTKQNPFTFGVWKRHSDFDKLATQVLI